MQGALANGPADFSYVAADVVVSSHAALDGDGAVDRHDAHLGGPGAVEGAVECFLHILTDIALELRGHARQLPLVNTDCEDQLAVAGLSRAGKAQDQAFPFHFVEGGAQFLERSGRLEAIVNDASRLRDGAQPERDFGLFEGEETLENADLDAGGRGREADRHPVQVLLEAAIERFRSHSSPLA